LTAQTVCLTQLAVLFPSEAENASCYKRMQRFLRAFDLDFAGLSRLLVKISGVPTPWVLALDRTNWKLGRAHLNVLMLCVVHEGIAFPLLWTLLEREGRGKAGNSNTKERIALLERFLDLFGAEPVSFLCADREFVSGEWLRWLKETGISFRLRLKGDVLVTNGRGEQVCACSCKHERIGYFETVRFSVSGHSVSDLYWATVCSYRGRVLMTGTF